MIVVQQRCGMLASMSLRTQQLTALYRLDHERLTLLAEQQKVVEQDEASAVAQLRLRRQALAQQLKVERERASDLDWELAETELRIQALTAEQAERSDPLAAREVAELRKHRDELEDEVLQQFEAIETSEQAQRQTEGEWQRSKEIAGEQQFGSATEAKRLVAALLATDQARQALLAELSDAERTAYQAADQRTPGTAIAPIEAGACSGCTTALSTTVLAALPTTCPHCERLLIELPLPATI